MNIIFQNEKQTSPTLLEIFIVKSLGIEILNNGTTAITFPQIFNPQSMYAVFNASLSSGILKVPANFCHSCMLSSQSVSVSFKRASK